MTIEGEKVRLLVDTGSSNLVLFKMRMPAALADAPWRGDKIVQSSGPHACAGSICAPSDSGRMSGTSCQRVRFDFERNEFGWSP
jgi:hypothetical protein